MKPFELLAQTISPQSHLSSGAASDVVIKLMRRDDEFLMVADRAILMSSRVHGSEEALATFACERVRSRKQPVILVGGLGMGFTLRAVLDLLPRDATVIVSELLPAVVEWNRGPLGPLAGHPLNDPRVHVEIGDVALLLRARALHFDAVLLDVDNGPDALTAKRNAGLYDSSGIAAAGTAVKPEGVLAVWAAQEDRKFEQRLRRAKFEVQMRYVRGRLEKGGPRHAIYLAYKTSR